MPRKSYPKIHKASKEEVSKALEKAKSKLDLEDYKIFESLVEIAEFINGKLEEKNARIAQLLKQIWGIK